MQVGQSLASARRHKGLTQEAVAERLGVSRQTVSKWETAESLPDIYQAQKLAKLYSLSIDELMDFDADVAAVEQAVLTTPDAVTEKIDWTAMWAQKYPVLASYQSEVDVNYYAQILQEQVEALRTQYHYSQEDALLVLKDILGKQFAE